MPKNRDRQRKNRKKYKPNESRLRSVNEFGIKDPTPQAAVANIINGEVKKQFEAE
jgi:hypothetical protein